VETVVNQYGRLDVVRNPLLVCLPNIVLTLK
jgi:hypothetical protein